jgi:pimeloyl-ACP methyl ester carboxylesterase
LLVVPLLVPVDSSGRLSVEQAAGDDAQFVTAAGLQVHVETAEYARVTPEKVDRLVLVSPAIFSSGGLPGWLMPLLTIPQIDRLGPLLVGNIASSGEDLLRQSFVDQSKLTHTERLLALFPNAELVVLSRSGHLAHEEVPGHFTAALVDWLGRTGP